jgi:lipid-A-disaccharide synthase
MLRTKSANPHYYIITGEKSADNIAADIMAELKLDNSSCSFSGIAGEKMQQQGCQSLFPQHDLSIMGFSAVIAKLPTLLRRIDQTVADIIAKQPDKILTIDSPDFCFRVMKKLRQKGYAGFAAHYVAPTVWAWKPKRAKKIAKLYDLLFTLYSFEPPYFTKHGLRTIFAGHNLALTTPKHQHGRYIGLLPGSRRQELELHLPIINAVANKIGVEKCLLLLADKKLQPLVDKTIATGISITEDKSYFLQNCHRAIAVSGTITLELALANIPTVVIYKATKFNEVFIKPMLTLRYVSLPNILLDEQIFPELLLKDANEENIWQQFCSLPSSINSQERLLPTLLGQNPKLSPAKQVATALQAS